MKVSYLQVWFISVIFSLVYCHEEREMVKEPYPLLRAYFLFLVMILKMYKNYQVLTVHR